MCYRSRRDREAPQACGFERLPGHHKTYAYGSVVHVMTAWIARCQCRHYRH